MSDFFELNFPSKRATFSPSTLSSERFLKAKYGDNAPLIGGYLLVADDLLKRASSWYEKDNLFASPRFLSKLSLFRSYAKAMSNNNTKDRAQEKDAQWKNFLDCRLTDDQLVELDEWQPSALEIFEYVDATLLDGYKLTVSYNKATQLASCTLIDRLKSRVSGGYGLSTSDTNAAAALKAAMFKHCLVLERDWSSLIGTPSRGGRRG